MLVHDMIFMDWIVKKGKKKIYRYFETYFSCFGPFGVWGVIAITIERNQKIQTLQIIDNMCVCVCVCVCV